MSSDSPPSCTTTALSDVSYSPVTLALGAFARSQALKSLRSAASLARSDFTALLEKSTFLPLGGRVFGEVASGSPRSCTRAVVVSTLAPADASVAFPGAWPGWVPAVA
ncbi:MAG: hypothetical protein IRY92_08095 [Dactylosporangium sp.]|nr:hypothetical protein [Dactylosporangium sp.]